MKHAVELVVKKGHSIRSLATDLSIPRSTLQRYVSLAKSDVTNCGSHLIVTITELSLMIKRVS